MFKEVVFDLTGGPCRSRHAAHFFNNPALVARMHVLHATPETVWELIEVTGDPVALARFRRVLAERDEPHMVGVEIVTDTPKEIQYIVKWSRPRSDESGLSMEFLLFDTVGPDSIYAMKIANGRAEVRVAGSDGEKLLTFFHDVRRRLEGRFTVRLLRVGEMKAGFPEGRAPGGALRDEDRRLVAVALAAGYYDNPKRCGVRELGDALGFSKSVVARKLRTIERRALESLVKPADVEAAVVGRAPAPPGMGPALAAALGELN